MVDGGDRDDGDDDGGDRDGGDDGGGDRGGWRSCDGDGYGEGKGSAPWEDDGCCIYKGAGAALDVMRMMMHVVVYDVGWRW